MMYFCLVILESVHNTWTWTWTWCVNNSQWIQVIQLGYRGRKL